MNKGKLELETQRVASCSQSYVLINQHSSIKEKEEKNFADGWTVVQFSIKYTREPV